MIRRFNYTDRKPIPLDRVRIRLLNVGKPEMTFDAEVNFEGLNLPEQSAVFVEAHYKASYMRFPFGTVGAITPPAVRTLSEIDRGTVVLFRVKVVDTAETAETHGRILAEIDGIVASEAEPLAAGRHSLLPVNYKDLGQEVWRLEFGTEPAVLELNNTIEGIKDLVKRDVRFLALVFPAIVREILTHILVVLQHDDTEDSSDWKSLWLRFATGYQTEPVPRDKDAEGRLEWIEDTVARYCDTLHVRDLMVQARAEDIR